MLGPWLIPSPYNINYDRSDYLYLSPSIQNLKKLLKSYHLFPNLTRFSSATRSPLTHLIPYFHRFTRKTLVVFLEFAVVTTPLALSRFGKAVNLAVYCVSDARPTFAYDILSTEPQRVKVYFSLLRMSPPLKRRFSELSLLCFPLRRIYPQA